MNDSGTENGLEKIEFEVRTELFQQLQQLMLDKGWEWEEGLRLLVGAGYSFFSNSLENSDNPGSEDLSRLTRRLMTAESELASLRFKIYELSESNRNWALCQGAIENENKALKKLIERYQQDES